MTFLRWGQGLVNRITRGNVIVNTIGGVKTYPPVSIVGFTRSGTATCETTFDTPNCTVTSTYTAELADVDPPVTLDWVVTGVSGPTPTITAGQGTNEITVTTTGNTDAVYDVELTATDLGGTDTLTTRYTDTRTAEPPIKVTIARTSGGSCEYPSAGTCESTSVIRATTTDATGTISYFWSISPVSGTAPTIISGQGENAIQVRTSAGTTDVTYNVTCVVGDDNSSGQTTEEFTDTKTPAPVGYIVAYGNGGFWSRSADQGATWSALTGEPTGTTYSATAYQQYFLWGGQDNIQRSTDYGVTYGFINSNTGGSGQDNSSMKMNANVVIIGQTGGYASRSTDYGASFTALTRGLNVGSNQEMHALNFSGTTWVAGFEAGYASRSTDNGATWTALTKGLNSGSTIDSIRAIAANGTVWVCAQNNGYASRSTDNGATWTALTKGLNSGNATATFRNIACNGSVWLAVGDSGYASRSTDNGATWTALPQFGNSIWEAAYCGDNIWVVAGSGGYASRSTDNGATWTPLTSGLNSGSTSVQFNNIAYASVA